LGRRLPPLSLKIPPQKSGALVIPG